ncbi:ankyrin repeat-containing protein [Anaeramoeba flamelloides]|uniref:Ankyrin repeat-containing protein n=1 Tax=Anaeramoeba flamelloides TaxID=1746091 RepID=A0AAV7YII4_9EUKA|nr:ankyrin repeat-containing protein [Anaeramoeba flamelloides]
MSKILKENNPDKIKEYLTKASDKEKNELLLLSIKSRKSLEIVKLILEGGANPNYEDKKHRSALQYCALMNNDTNVLTALLDFGADPNCNYGEVSPIFLHLCGKKVDKNVIDILLKNGADVNYHKMVPNLEPKQLEQIGNNYVEILLKKKIIKYEIIDVFLKYGIKMDSENKTSSPLTFICKRPDFPIETLKKIYENCTNKNFTDSKGNTILHLATNPLKRNFELMKLLLENKHDPNVKNLIGFTPFHLLCKQKKITMEEIQLFLKFNTDINLQSDEMQRQIYSPFRLILENSADENIIMYFLENGADPNDNVSLALAIKMDAPLKIIKTMVENGAEINPTLRPGQTPPIHMCKFNKESNILKYLISKGVDLNVLMFTRTILENVCSKEYLKKDFIEAILDVKTGLDVNAGRAFTPLMEYVKNDFDKRLFDKFLNKGAILEKDIFNQTRSVLSSYCYNENFKKENFQEIYELTKSSENIRSILKDALSVTISIAKDFEKIEYVFSYFEEKPLTEKEKFQILLESLYEVECLENIKYMIETKNFPVEYEIENNRENAMFVAMMSYQRLDVVYYLLDYKPLFDKPVKTQFYSMGGEDFLLQHHFLKLLFGNPGTISYHFARLSENCQITQYQFLKKALEVGMDPNLPTYGEGFTALMFLGNIEHDLAFKCAKLLIKHGADPFITNKNGESFFTFPPINESIHQEIKNYLSIVEDFQQLFQREENTDLEIKTIGNQIIKAHSVILLNRIDNGLSVEQILECFSNYKKNDLMHFLNWVYSGYALSERGEKKIQAEMLKIALELNFTEKQFNEKSYLRGLLFDLNKLYLDQNSKDFTILVPIEKEIEEMEDEKEKKEEEEQEETIKEIKAHKVILQARSELFRGLFSSISQSENKVRDYTGKQFKTLEILISFIYSNKIKKKIIEEEILMELSDVMEYYQLSKHSAFKEQRKKAKNYNRQLLQERLDRILNN